MSYLLHRRKAFQGGSPCTTLRDSNTNSPTGQHPCGNASSNQKVATRFAAGASYDCCKIALTLSAVGTPAFNVRASIWSHNSGADTPNAIVGGWSDYVAASAGWSDTEVDFPNVTATGLVSGTDYWIVIEHTGSPDFSNHVLVRWTTTSSFSPKRVRNWNGSSWAATTDFRSLRGQTYST